MKAKADVGGVERAAIHPESYDSGLEPQNPITSPIKVDELFTSKPMSVS